MDKDLNVSLWIFRCETSYAWIFECINWYMYLQIFTDFSQKFIHVQIIFQMQKLVQVPTDFYRSFSKICATCTDYIRMGIAVNVRLSVYTCNVIHNFGVWHYFDATAKYWHWLERADVILLHSDVTLLPIHTCTQWRYIMVLCYMSVTILTTKKWSVMSGFLYIGLVI